MKLNPEQNKAVKYIDGPLLVLAGAGSGKTRVITQKIAYLVQECGYKATNITALTFTNKTAKEMKQRVGGVLSRAERRGLTVSTFHNLGLSIIKKELASLGLKPGFSIFDSSDSLNLMRNLLSRHEGSDKDFLFQVQMQISNWKNEMLCPQQAIATQWDSPIKVSSAKIYATYNDTLTAYNAVDFDDLILHPVQLFKNNPDILSRWQNKIRYLLVDEYQDTNDSQYQLVKMLTGVRAAFTVVGDDDQSIYAWRGAKPENLHQLNKDFPTLSLIKLEQNYRSSACILKSANHLIANNPHVYEKKLWSALGFGELLRVVYTLDEVDEAEQVAAEIISHKLRFNTKFNEYAVLYRGNHQSRAFEKSFRNAGIPYKISGGQSYFSRGEIKDIFAYIRLMVNVDDDNAFLRIINTPKRGLGTSSIEHLGRYAHGCGKSLFRACSDLGLTTVLPVKTCEKLSQFQRWLSGLATAVHAQETSVVLKQLVNETGYESYLYDGADNPQQAEKRMQNVWDLLTWIERLTNKKEGQPASLEDVVSKLILLDIMERDDESELEQVQLMTLHASKGLEFPHVFLVGMEEELLPHRNSIEDDNIEEERRLAYVGVTRAQKTLCMTLAKSRKRYGEITECQPSRFLDELPQDCLEWEGRARVSSEPKTKQKGKSHLAGLKAMLEKPNPSTSFQDTVE